MSAALRCCAETSPWAFLFHGRLGASMSAFLKPLQGTCSWAGLFLGSPATAPEGLLPVTALCGRFLPGFGAKCLHDASQLRSQGSLTKHSRDQEQHIVVPLSVYPSYMHPLVRLSIPPPTRSFVHPFTCPFVHLSIHLSSAWCVLGTAR